MNKSWLKKHRQVVFSEAFNIYADRVFGKRYSDAETLQRSYNRIKYRESKLKNLGL